MSRKLLNYKKNEQYSELFFGLSDIRLSDYVKNYSGPVIVYDLEVIRERVRWVQRWPQLGKLHYAVKANFNLEILKLLKSLNCGADVVSVGEIKRAFAAGFLPQDIIFSGVGKSREELKWAIENNIYQINAESLSEIRKISEIAKKIGKKVQLGLRINPEIDAETHPSISTALKDSKFGLDFDSGRSAAQMISEDRFLELKALSFHLGSQIMNTQVFEKALSVMKPYYKSIQAVCPELERFDLGGGIGIDYQDADNDTDRERWQNLQSVFERDLKDFKAFYLLEIGRFLVARSGVLLSRVEILKETSTKKFMILDVGMTHIMRPALYGAYHHILPLVKRSEELYRYDVVGPICESTDVLAEGRNISPVQEEDFVAICDVGAYGSVMASRYNLRDEATEVVI
jgi:diaminopimelate decarboxylase